LQTTWLWEKIRVQGGAYGGMSTYDRLSGFFGYVSYRDPNLLKTLDNYAGTPDFLRNVPISQDELTKTIIGTIGDIDGYQLPDAKGFTALARWLAGVSDENRQEMREQVMSTNVEDFRAFADYLDRLNGSAATVVLGSPDLIQEANAGLGSGALPITRVL
jgi:Zn-dependent M16 (insulinase) family peptidase